MLTGRTMASAGRCAALVAGLCGAGCRLDDPSTITASTIFSITIDKTQLEADSVSRAVVSIQLSGETREDADVVFETDRGRFVGADPNKPGELKIKAGARTATAVFVAGAQPGAADISVSVGGATRDTSIALTASRPTKVFLSPSQTTAKADGAQTITFSAALTRPEIGGVVSLGTRVDFVATDTLGIEFPELRGASTYSSTNTPLTYRLSRSVAGPILVHAEIANSSPLILSNTVRVNFSP